MNQRTEGNGSFPLARSRGVFLLRCTILGLFFAIAPRQSVRAAENLSVFSPAAGNAASIRDLFLLVLWITGAIFVLVEGVLVYCILRFRRGKTDDDQEPPQLYGSMPVELAWTVGPLITCFVLFLVVARTVIASRRDDPPPTAVRVVAVGHQWWWEFRYPDHGFVTANELRVPLGTEGNPRPVYLELQSADVVHSFWVPRLGGKTDLVPGRRNFLWFEPTETGTFLGQCAEYCGTQHANMLLRVIVEPEEDFAKWADGQKGDAHADPAVADARALFLEQNCVNCHTVRGTLARGTFGPDLTHVASRQTIGAGVANNTAADLKRWVFDAQALKPGCLMPSLHLSEARVDTIVRYLQSLR